MAAESRRRGSVDAQNPWPGLESFYEEDRTFFHGRAAETRELFDLVQRRRLTVLHGLSGLGKSSLLRAGLFPELRDAGFLPVIVRLDFTDDRRGLGSQVLRAIAGASSDGVDAPDLSRAESLWEAFHRSGSRFWDARNRPLVPVLVIDQFEEIFTLGRADAETRDASHAFLVELADLIEGRVPESLRASVDANPELAAGFEFGRHDYKVVLALREDYLADLGALRPMMPSVTLNRMRLLAMNGEQALDVVRLPGGDLVDAGTAERIVRFVSGGDPERTQALTDLVIEPSLLSLTCRELNEARKRASGSESERISLALVDIAGSDILDGFYARSVADLPLEVRRYLEEALITVSGHRDSVDVDNALKVEGLDEAVIGRLEDRRLVRREERGGRVRLELTHDVLARPVRRSRAVREEREAAEAEEAARKAADAARKEAEERAAKSAERERVVSELLRRTRIFGAVMVVLALAAGGLAWSAVLAQRRATDAAQLANYNLARLYESRATAALDRVVDLGSTAYREAFLYSLAAFAEDIGDRELPITRDRLRFALEPAFAVTSISRANASRDPLDRKVAWSPDGDLLAVTGHDQSVRIWNMVSGEEVRVGPSGEVLDVSWSPGGESVATAHLDGNVRVWKADTGEVTADLGGDLLRAANSVSWSPDGEWLALGDASGQVRIRDAATGAQALVFSVTTGRRVRVVSWSPDGGSIASVGEDGSVRVSDPVSGAELTVFAGHSGRVYGLKWSPDGGRLASAGEDGTVRVWNSQTGAEVSALTGHSGRVNGVSWSPDGRRLASAGDDGTVRLWNSQQGADTAVFSGHAGSVRSVSWRPDGGQLASIADDGTVLVWNAETGAAMAVLSSHSNWVNGVSWSPDGQRLASGGRDGFVRVWNPETGAQTDVFRGGHSGSITSVAWSPDGDRLAFAGGLTGTVGIWDTLASSQMPLMEGHQGEVNSLAWSPDGGSLASAANDRTVRVWDVQSGAPVAVLDHSTQVEGVAWSPDSGALASAGDADGSVRLWDVATGLQTAVLVGHTSSVQGLSWSPDGSLLASASRDETVRIWEIATGATRAYWRGHEGGVSDVQWSPDGALLASVGSTVRVWSRTQRVEIAVLAGLRGSVNSVSWSPDGSQLAWGEGEGSGSVAVWRVPRHFAGHSQSVESLSWSAESGLASVGREHTVRLWSPETGTERAVLGRAREVSWRPGGGSLAALAHMGNGARERVLVWDTAAGAEPSVIAIAGVLEGGSAVSWSSDGQFLAWLDDGGVVVRDFANGIEATTFGDDVQAMSWSPDGGSIATMESLGTVRVWGVATGAEIAVWPGQWFSLNSLTWSPDGERLAAASPVGVRVWDAQTGTQVGDVAGHVGVVYDVSWSPSGGHLASGGADGTIRLTEWPGGAETAVLPHPPGVNSLAWSPDGETLVSGGSDGTMRLWGGGLEPLLPLAEAGRLSEALDAALYLFGYELRDFELTSIERPAHFEARGDFTFPQPRRYEMLDRPRPQDIHPVQWLVAAVEAEADRTGRR